MDIIKIGGVTIPHPSTISIGMQDLDSPDSTRNELGFLQRDRIRAGVYKVSLGFITKTGPEIATIESMISPASIEVTFPDSSGMITKTMYVGDRTKNIVLYKEGDFEEMVWDLSFDLVEY